MVYGWVLLVGPSFGVMPPDLGVCACKGTVCGGPEADCCVMLFVFYT